MADSSSELPRTRSEYIPPTTIPPAASHATIPDERVHIAGKVDRRHAKTVFSRRAVRASRSARWSLVAAAAFGAALAALLFVRHFTPQAAPPKVRSGVTVESSLEIPAASPSVPALSAPEASSPAKDKESVTQAAVSEATLRARSAEPAAVSPVSSQDSAREGSGGAPPSAAGPEASGNKVWLKPPPRKVWVD